MGYGPTRPGKGKSVCHYCGIRAGITTDHIVPRALGGPDSMWNYQPACVQCNSEKKSYWPTCPCEKCTEARRRFSEDPTLRVGAVSTLIHHKSNMISGIDAMLGRIEILRERASYYDDVLEQLGESNIH